CPRQGTCRARLRSAPSVPPRGRRCAAAPALVATLVFSGRRALLGIDAHLGAAGRVFSRQAAPRSRSATIPSRPWLFRAARNRRRLASGACFLWSAHRRWLQARQSPYRRRVAGSWLRIGRTLHLPLRRGNRRRDADRFSTMHPASPAARRIYGPVQRRRLWLQARLAPAADRALPRKDTRRPT